MLGKLCYICHMLKCGGVKTSTSVTSLLMEKISNKIWCFMLSNFAKSCRCFFNKFWLIWVFSSSFFAFSAWSVGRSSV